jgi:hypothetical protein
MSEIWNDWPPELNRGKPWSKAKLKILELLWPMEWLEGSKIYEAVQQTYYDRHIRELRESGWQIATHPSGKMYRLQSHQKLPGNIRRYPSPGQKRQVRDRDKDVCQICRLPDQNMQYDHKVPLERNGPTEVDNLQLLCRACNVEKRGACKRCTLETCDGCPYAYPELFGSRVVIFLDGAAAEKLRASLELQGIPETIIVREILSNHFRKVTLR